MQIVKIVPLWGYFNSKKWDAFINQKNKIVES